MKEKDIRTAFREAEERFCQAKVSLRALENLLEFRGFTEGELPQFGMGDNSVLSLRFANSVLEGFDIVRQMEDVGYIDKSAFSLKTNNKGIQIWKK